MILVASTHIIVRTSRGATLRKDRELGSLSRGPLLPQQGKTRSSWSFFPSSFLPFILCSLKHLFPRSNRGISVFRFFRSLSTSQRLHLSDSFFRSLGDFCWGLSGSREFFPASESHVPLLLPLWASPRYFVLFPGPCRLRRPYAPTLAPPVPCSSLARPLPAALIPHAPRPGRAGPGTATCRDHL